MAFWSLGTGKQIFDLVGIYRMQDQRLIRRFLELASAKLLATVLVSCHLDYCNSLLFGIANIDVARLQRVQNWLACLVTKSPPCTVSFSTALFPSLVVSKVQNIVQDQFCWPTKPCVKTQHVLPSFHACCISPRATHWDRTKVIVCQCLGSRTTQVQEVFHSCALSLWDNLLLSVCAVISVATFKKHLKTYLFDCAFPP